MDNKDMTQVNNNELLTSNVPNKPIGNKTPSNNVIISQDVLNNLINNYKELSNRIRELETNGQLAPKEVDTNTARLRVWDNKLVVGYDDKIGIRTDKEHNSYITIILEDGSKHEVNYNEFLSNADIVEVKIKEVRKANKIQNFGIIEKTEVVDYKTVGTGIYVPMTVESFIAEAVIVTPDGKERVIDTKFLNM